MSWENMWSVVSDCRCLKIKEQKKQQVTRLLTMEMKLMGKVVWLVGWWSALFLK